MENVIEELNKIKYKYNDLDQVIINGTTSLNSLDSSISVCERQQKGIIETRQYYKKAVDIIYERSIQELKDILNSALAYIFTDKDLTADIELTDKRGKSLKFVIKDKGRKVSLKRGTGMGIKCVISAILHIYYLQCKNSKVLMLDEAYSNISKEYVSEFFDFLDKLCKKLGFVVILITHDERFKQYADKVYQVSNGNVQLVKDCDVQQTFEYKN